MTNLRILPATVAATLAFIMATTCVEGAHGDDDTLTRIVDLENRVDRLSLNGNCLLTAMPATIYHDPKTGLTYLSPTRRKNHKRFWISVMSPKCVPNNPTKKDLEWRFPK